MPLFRKRNDRLMPTNALASAGGPQARARAVSQNSDVSMSSNAGSEIANGSLVVGSVDSHDSSTSLEAFGKRPRSLLLHPGMCQDPDTADWVMNTDPLKPQTPMLTSSRLSKTLCEVLHDKDALPYFIQYMASKGGEQIIKFWLDAESFQASSWTRIRTHSLKTVQQQTLGTSPPNSDSSATKSDSCSKDTDLHSSTGAAPMASDTTWASSGPAQSQVAMATGEDSVDGCSSQACGTSALATPPQSLPSPAPVGTDASTVPPEFATPVDCEPLCSPHTDCGTTHKPHQMSPQGSAGCGLDSTLVASGDSQSGSSCLDQEVPVPVEGESAEKTSPLRNHSEDSFQERLRKSIERDAVTIYSKYISLDATRPIGISEDLRNETISKICREDGQVDPLCFARCQEYVVNIMDNVYFQGFLQSEFHCKHQIDILTGTQVHLADVLYNESALFYFMEYMEQEGAMDLLQCWLAMDNFQQQLSERHGYYDGMEAQNDAMVIYEKYFSLQCTNPLGFEDKVRMEVELNICREEGPLPDCFATPKKQVLRTIEKVYFPRFIQNELYSKYLNELISTIQLAHDLPMTGHKRTGSDASSEKSLGSASANSEPISSKNTLLASSSHTYQKTLNPKVINKITDDMRIDSVLFNPDALWKRSATGKNMSLGRVNEVGQFISELDPEPDNEKKKKGFFTLRKNDGQTQEEMAMQIAQMIISDVTRVTQGGPTGQEPS